MEVCDFNKINEFTKIWLKENNIDNFHTLNDCFSITRKFIKNFVIPANSEDLFFTSDEFSREFYNMSTLKIKRNKIPDNGIEKIVMIIGSFLYKASIYNRTRANFIYLKYGLENKHNVYPKKYSLKFLKNYPNDKKIRSKANNVIRARMTNDLAKTRNNREMYSQHLDNDINTMFKALTSRKMFKIALIFVLCTINNICSFKLSLIHI